MMGDNFRWTTLIQNDLRQVLALFHHGMTQIVCILHIREWGGLRDGSRILGRRLAHLVNIVMLVRGDRLTKFRAVFGEIHARIIKTRRGFVRVALGFVA